MMNTNSKNRISGFFFLFLGIFLWIAIPYQIKSDGMTTMGPEFFPKFLSVGLIILSILLIIQTFVKEKQGRGQNSKNFDINLKSELRVLLIFFIITIYAVMIPYLGFVISTILFMGIALFLLNVRKWYFYGALIAFSFVVYYVFEKLLYVQLP